MPRLESVVSPFPAGSGRFQDNAWPGIGNAQYTGQVNFNCSTRSNPPGLANFSFMANANGVQNNWNMYLGLPSVAIGTVDPNRGGMTSNANGAPRINLEQNPFPTDYDIQHVVKVTIVCAWPNVSSAANRDYGISFLRDQSITSSILTNNGQGFGWNVDVNGALSFIRRGAVGLDVIPLPTINPVVWHTYSLTFTGATSAAPAAAEAAVDDVPVYSWNWNDPNAPLYLATAGGKWFFCLFAAAGTVLQFNSYRLASSETALGVN